MQTNLKQKLVAAYVGDGKFIMRLAFMFFFVGSILCVASILWMRTTTFSPYDPLPVEAVVLDKHVVIPKKRRSRRSLFTRSTPKYYTAVLYDFDIASDAKETQSERYKRHQRSYRERALLSQTEIESAALQSGYTVEDGHELIVTTIQVSENDYNMAERGHSGTIYVSADRPYSAYVSPSEHKSRPVIMALTGLLMALLGLGMRYVVKYRLT